MGSHSHQTAAAFQLFNLSTSQLPHKLPRKVPRSLSLHFLLHQAYTGPGPFYRLAGIVLLQLEAEKREVLGVWDSLRLVFGHPIRHLLFV